MAINKKKSLGREPDRLGDKDAVHVAIVSMIASRPIQPGGRVRIANDGTAEPGDDSDGIGVADPWGGRIHRGKKFWVLMDIDSVSAVEHTWSCGIQFKTENVVVKQNRYLEEIAREIGVSYDELMKACDDFLENDRLTDYGGVLSEGAALKAVRLYDMWSEWAGETGYEFPNMGSECCPEYEYPDCLPFRWV